MVSQVATRIYGVLLLLLLMATPSISKPSTEIRKRLFQGKNNLRCRAQAQIECHDSRDIYEFSACAKLTLKWMVP